MQQLPAGCCPQTLNCAPRATVAAAARQAAARLSAGCRRHLGCQPAHSSLSRAAAKECGAETRQVAVAAVRGSSSSSKMAFLQQAHGLRAQGETPRRPSWHAAARRACQQRRSSEQAPHTGVSHPAVRRRCEQQQQAPRASGAAIKRIEAVEAGVGLASCPAGGASCCCCMGSQPAHQQPPRRRCAVCCRQGGRWHVPAAGQGQCCGGATHHVALARQHRLGEWWQCGHSSD